MTIYVLVVAEGCNMIVAVETFALLVVTGNEFVIVFCPSHLNEKKNKLNQRLPIIFILDPLLQRLQKSNSCIFDVNSLRFACIDTKLRHPNKENMK